ncbi:MAG: DUF1848 family protein [Candidatus Hermodarchaeota archaeon]
MQNKVNLKIIKSPIISCSRRTDVPAFLMDWLINLIKNENYVDVVNPFNRSQISRVSLNHKDVKCWCWWSKDFSTWIRCYKENKELFNLYKGHYFQFTINSPSELEKNLKISLEERFKQLKWLINEFGKEAVNFRFDPIILYRKKDSSKIQSNLDKFEYIIENITALGLREMIFSFATIYSKVKKRMNARGYIPIDLTYQKKKEILPRLMQICDQNNIQMKACCQPELLKIKGIEQAHCIDAYKIENIINEEIPKIKDSGQRKACGCYKSKDIAGYSGIFRCKHNCAYCYASPAKK